jgi:hypothetical protein
MKTTQNTETSGWGEKVEWTNDHCERCHGSWRPKLIWQEIWCREHYEEAMNEDYVGVDREG